MTTLTQDISLCLQSQPLPSHPVRPRNGTDWTIVPQQCECSNPMQFCCLIAGSPGMHLQASLAFVVPERKGEEGRGRHHLNKQSYCLASFKHELENTWSQG